MDQLNNYFDNILKTDNINPVKKKKKKKKNAFYFTLKALFALKICKILS